MTNSKLLIQEFRKFCESSRAKHELLNELNWYDMSIGWFLAKGISVSRAFKLARTVRYDSEYWETDDV